MNFSAIAANTPEDILIRYHQKTPDALLFGPNVSALQAQDLSRRIGLDAVESYTLHAYSGSDRQDQAQLRSLLEQLKAKYQTGPCDVQTEQHHDFAEFIGCSAPMKKLYNEISKVARTDLPVLLIGESGTGKELAARAIHRCSARKNQAYVPINCSAISEHLIESELFGHEKGSFTGAERNRQGYFELADQGTLFLDEVTEMPIDAQTKLLRALENGEYMKVGGDQLIKHDARIIAATNRPPMRAIEDKKLREDLYYRLGVFPIQIPPLRERGDDAVLIAKHLVEQLNQEHQQNRSLSLASMQEIERYHWPGNIRQLRNAILRSYVMSSGDHVEINMEADPME
ncbi:sigma-54 interaction domain-containing protein [Alcaligenes faecalis]|uniref:sigma-54 interaction domain-containing protein n=1 Tax=Alcaligenes faecalis TaxID=511 RepID=UPI001F3D172B|nr:sigma-54 dependent transcriptional regulator [Alcaligenes faecalis]